MVLKLTVKLSTSSAGSNLHVVNYLTFKWIVFNIVIVIVIINIIVIIVIIVNIIVTILISLL